MPEVFRWRGFRFFFYSNEGSPREPCHVHVEHADGEAKVWLDPEIRLASSFGLSSRQLGTILAVVREREARIREKWDEYFGQ
ncbi:DUF4160 domain-containing protein [Betaproteobacteria bacterium PRO7]|jgi:hypothetical protein|nr:DUF4160 domain-containing protein [Burkholderiaceae bacterium]MDL1860115.1 DUF4160 domain-containing protein [Betaproteobacteria bacterium PRO7]GIL04470.1 MAG: hypothetical protein BroJett031_09900 [Betaproteobacteria bacterium]